MDLDDAAVGLMVPAIAHVLNRSSVRSAPRSKKYDDWAGAATKRAVATRCGERAAQAIVIIMPRATALTVAERSTFILPGGTTTSLENQRR